MCCLYCRLLSSSWQLALAVVLLCLGAGAQAASFTVANPYATSTNTTDITIRKLFVFGDSYSRAGRKTWHNWAEQLRFDVINLLDSSYQIRDGEGVGVGAPQYGQRRTFLLTLAQKF